METVGMKGSATGSGKSASFDKTWESSASSGYCSDDEAPPELEQYFTARTSLGRKPRVELKKVRTDSLSFGLK